MIGGFVGNPIGGVVYNGNVYLVATAGAYTITGNAATFTDKIVVTAGSYTINGSAALFADTMVASAGAYTITGQGAAFADSMPAASGSYALTGNAATFSTVMRQAGGQPIGGYIGAGIGGVIYISNQPVFPATYQITGNAAVLASSEAATPGAYAIAGSPVAYKITMACAAGAYVLTGSPVAFTQVINGSGGETKKLYRGRLELERRKIRITDDEGRSRKVDLLRHLKPPPPFAPAPDWVLPAVPDVPSRAEAALPIAPQQPAPRLPDSLLALQDARDENELVEFLTNTPDPLVEDIRQVLGILAASGQLDRLLETA